MSIVIECLEQRTFKNEEEARKYILDNAIVRIPTENGLEVSKVGPELN